MMIWLRLFHIVAGAVWVGSAFFGAFLLMPAARAAGPEGGRFVGKVMARVGPVMGIAMLFTLVPGFIMYAQLAGASGFAASPTGMALGVGAAASLLAIVVGFGVNGPAARKMAAVQQKLAGGAPAGPEAAELGRLQARIAGGAKAAALLLMVAVGAMAVARYL